MANKKALLLVLFWVLVSPLDLQCWGEGPTATELSAPTPEIPAAVSVGQNSQSLLTATLKMIAALALIVGLMLVLMVWLKKMGLGLSRTSSTSQIKVLDTRMIAPKKYISVVAVGKQIVVLGITDQAVNLLTTLEDYDIDDMDRQRQGRPFAEWLNKSSAVMPARK